MKAKTRETIKKAGIGAGVLAAAAGAAAAGYYFYASDNAKKHRQAASRWAKGLKTDVVREAKKLKRLDRGQIVRVVDEAALAYENMRGLDKKDLARAVKELKRNWQNLEAEVRTKGQGAVRRAKTGAKRAATKARPASKRRG